jgi:hypothetical protein
MKNVFFKKNSWHSKFITALSSQTIDLFLISNFEGLTEKNVFALKQKFIRGRAHNNERAE